MNGKKYAVKLEFVGHTILYVDAESSEQAHEKGLEAGVSLDINKFSDETEVSVVDFVEVAADYERGEA